MENKEILYTYTTEKVYYTLAYIDSITFVPLLDPNEKNTIDNSYVILSCKDKDTGKWWYRSLRKFKELNKSLVLLRFKEEVHRLLTCKAVFNRLEWAIYYKNEGIVKP